MMKLHLIFSVQVQILMKIKLIMFDILSKCEKYDMKNLIFQNNKIFLENIPKIMFIIEDD